MKLQEGRFIQGLRNMFSLRWDMADPDEIHNTIISGAKLQGTNMCILMLAILIASIGLNMNSTAVIIGAMLISPLMGGITTIGYGIATNDLTLSKCGHKAWHTGGHLPYHLDYLLYHFTYHHSLLRASCPNHTYSVGRSYCSFWRTCRHNRSDP